MIRDFEMKIEQWIADNERGWQGVLQQHFSVSFWMSVSRGSSILAVCGGEPGDQGGHDPTGIKVGFVLVDENHRVMEFYYFYVSLS